MFYVGVIKMLVVCGRVYKYVNFCVILTSSKLPDKAFKIWLHFISYKSSTDCQWNEIQVCTTKSIKKDRKDKVYSKEI